VKLGHVGESFPTGNHRRRFFVITHVISSCKVPCPCTLIVAFELNILSLVFFDGYPAAPSLSQQHAVLQLPRLIGEDGATSSTRIRNLDGRFIDRVFPGQAQIIKALTCRLANSFVPPL
jgi:hypothetical protein